MFSDVPIDLAAQLRNSTLVWHSHTFHLKEEESGDMPITDCRSCQFRLL